MLPIFRKFLGEIFNTLPPQPLNYPSRVAIFFVRSLPGESRQVAVNLVLVTELFDFKIPGPGEFSGLADVTEVSISETEAVLEHLFAKAIYN